MTTFTTEDRITAFGQCGCGRSPTGACCGWHGLTEDEYRVKLAEYEIKQTELTKQIDKTEGKSE